MKVVVCGAGIAGLTVANQLARSGIDTVFVEQAPGPRPQGYMIDFFGPGYDAAEAMGVLPRIIELGYRIRELVYVDEHGRRRVRLTMNQLDSVVGGRLVSILRPDLELALRQHLPDTVELRGGTRLVGLDSAADAGTITVTFADGSHETADLLIGADGVHSTMRRLTFGPDNNFLRYLGFHTAAYIFEAPVLAAEMADRYSLTDTINARRRKCCTEIGVWVARMACTTDTLPPVLTPTRCITTRSHRW
ncbi:FAD-dependent monooxygenase [Nocardia sp. NPDC050710]|uniref:FAD-dependent monooxygenase n=1 Tax=Nocardia sp. NPDC050710 TaxID=3157220 RepID=UPI0033FA5390